MPKLVKKLSAMINLATIISKVVQVVVVTWLGVYAMVWLVTRMRR